MSGPLLILCAEGIHEPAERASITAMADRTGERLGVEVRVADAGAQTPTIADVVASVPINQVGLAGVIVPCVLAGDYQVHADIARAVAERPDIVTTGALGPDERLIGILLDRVKAASVHPTATLVLSAAGSSDPRSQGDTEVTLDALRLAWDGPVRVGYVAGVKPTVGDAVSAARKHGEEGADADVAVVSYLLSPGSLQDGLHTVGADHVTAPLAPDDRLTAIIADRYRDAAGG